MQAAATQPLTSNWPAWLELAFEPRGPVTRLTRRRHLGPLLVQQVFHPEADGTCHSYLLHPPAGVVGGDALCIDLQVAEQARALITTPAACKFYRSDGRLAEQRVQLDVAGDLEWLPPETIVFDEANARSSVHVDLAAEARFIGWEILCLGRTASGEGFDAGRYRGELALYRAGRPVWIDRLVVDSAAMRQSRWGLAGKPVTATMLATAPELDAAALVRDLREALVPGSGDLLAVSAVDGVVVLRWLGGRSDHARELFEQAWTLLRPAVLGKAPMTPRIWRT